MPDEKIVSPPPPLPVIGQRCVVQPAPGHYTGPKRFLGVVYDYDSDPQHLWMRVQHPFIPGYPTFLWDEVTLLEEFK